MAWTGVCPGRSALHAVRSGASLCGTYLTGGRPSSAPLDVLHSAREGHRKTGSSKFVMLKSIAVAGILIAALTGSAFAQSDCSEPIPPAAPPAKATLKQIS